MRRATALLAAGALAAGLSACGEDEDGGTAQTTTVERTKVEVVERGRATGGLDPAAVYERGAAGVVTVISLLRGGGALDLLQPPDREGDDDRRAAEGSGFVVSEEGEVLTNAHVVTSGQGEDIKRAKEVFVKFADGNQVPAKIAGVDPNSDVALLRIEPRGLTLRPLPLGSARGLKVGQPVAAIGSPFGEEQSLSVGVVSALDRTIESLTQFSISGAIQTDAAINHGNSGGPLVNARGEVIGVNSQIRSTGGGGEGVGFAVSVDTVKRSLEELRDHGEVKYAYLGVQTVALYPQLVERFDLPVERGAWIQEVTDDGPAEKADLEAGKRKERFQVDEFNVGGDVITAVDGRPIRKADDLGEAISSRRPGETVRLEIYRDGRRRQVSVKLAERPAGAPAPRRRR